MLGLGTGSEANAWAPDPREPGRSFICKEFKLSTKEVALLDGNGGTCSRLSYSGGGNEGTEWFEWLVKASA